MDESNKQALFSRGLSFLRLGKCAEVLLDAERLSILYPLDSDSRWLKGKALFSLDKKQEALLSWEEGARLSYGNVLFLEEMGEAKSVVDCVNKRFENSTVSGKIVHGTGDEIIDKKIAAGYYLVNTQKPKEAIEYFSELLKEHPKLVAAFLARGTAMVFTKDLDGAMKDFSQAIAIDNHCAEAWKRRGLVRTLKGQNTEAISDFSFSIKNNSKDPEAIHQRGLLYFKMENYIKSSQDFEAGSELDSDPKLQKSCRVNAGVSLTMIGKAKEALSHLTKVIATDSTNKEAWLHLGNAYRDLGNSGEAESAYEMAVNLDNGYLLPYHSRGFMRMGTGHHQQAIEDFTSAVNIDKEKIEPHMFLGLALQDVGRYSEAEKEYEFILEREPANYVFYMREIMRYHKLKLDEDVYSFCQDVDIDALAKEQQCKRIDHTKLVDYKPHKFVEKNIEDNQCEESLVKNAKRFGERMQYSCPGFLSNKRMQVAFGMAIMEIAQDLQNVFKKNLYTINRVSSDKKRPKKRLYSWRDFLDVAVRWRQMSELNDPVWYIDQLPAKNFAEGYGSHTPMIMRQTTIIRYSPFAPRAFEIVKKLIPEKMNTLTKEKQQLAVNAKEWTELLTILGDFFLHTNCYSQVTPGEKMDGTRITIKSMPPYGKEFSVQTPCVPDRWVRFDKEIDYAWNRFVESAKKYLKNRDNLDEVSNRILTLTFYIYNLMPLSRGTAASVYASMLGMFLSIGIEITSSSPPGMQIDWEAILGERPEEFIQALQGWIYPSRKDFPVEDLENIHEKCATLRKMIMTLNCS